MSENATFDLKKKLKYFLFLLVALKFREIFFLSFFMCCEGKLCISLQVPLVSNVGATGLGATPAPDVAAARTNAAKRKLRMLKMTQTRYNQPPKVPQNDSGEE